MSRSTQSLVCHSNTHSEGLFIYNKDEVCLTKAIKRRSMERSDGHGRLNVLTAVCNKSLSLIKTVGVIYQRKNEWSQWSFSHLCPDHLWRVIITQKRKEASRRIKEHLSLMMNLQGLSVLQSIVWYSPCQHDADATWRSYLAMLEPRGITMVVPRVAWQVSD